MPPVTAYIALGANLGDRERNLRDALALLEGVPDVKVNRVSPFLDNPTVGGPPDSPPFLNAAAELQTTLAARDLLQKLLEIEQSLGRVRRERWGPRVIDLDLLVYGPEMIAMPNLVVPHPRLRERRFVLEPLASIAPDLVVPGLGQTVAELLRRLAM
ncbi:MAG TPA: 2-amino-4-hydroxy-6-hydroxymethyldihydropteridine diphosphokinase [Tepidisphaeraceae bacterium]|nr:2-amino-4-hydroxy-6-hydroxymethyldihydropteridine diphosphokinase [Tepidisphaeraceae bacterium]